MGPTAFGRMLELGVPTFRTVDVRNYENALVRYRRVQSTRTSDPDVRLVLSMNVPVYEYTA